MTPEEYRKSVLRSESPKFVMVDARILHAILGIVTEAGELADALKKVMFYGREMDGWKFIEELGDGRWYEELLCDALNTDMEEVKEMNIRKLKKRYPDQFDDVEVRDYEAEQRAAEVEALGVVSPGVYIPRCFGSEVTGSACMTCPHKKECDSTYYSNHEDGDDPDKKQPDQSTSPKPECFGKAVLGIDEKKQEAADHNYQKCLGCLDRGECFRASEKPKEERPVPECFPKYRPCSIYCTTVCDARTLCKAETPE